MVIIIIVIFVVTDIVEILKAVWTPLHPTQGWAALETNWKAEHSSQGNDIRSNWSTQPRPSCGRWRAWAGARACAAAVCARAGSGRSHRGIRRLLCMCSSDVRFTVSNGLFEWTSGRARWPPNARAGVKSLFEFWVNFFASIVFAYKC